MWEGRRKGDWRTLSGKSKDILKTEWETFHVNTRVTRERWAWGVFRNNTVDVLGPEELNQMIQGSAPGGMQLLWVTSWVLLQTQVWRPWHQTLGPREPFCLKTLRKMHQSPAHGKHRQAHQYSTPKWTPKLYLRVRWNHLEAAVLKNRPSFLLFTNLSEYKLILQPKEFACLLRGQRQKVKIL